MNSFKDHFQGRENKKKSVYQTTRIMNGLPAGKNVNIRKGNLTVKKMNYWEKREKDKHHK